MNPSRTPAVRSSRRLLAILTAVLTLVAGGAFAGPALAQEPVPGSTPASVIGNWVHLFGTRLNPFPQQPSSGVTPGALPQNGIQYHGGPIVPSLNVATIYWGSSTIYTGGPTPGTTGSGASDGSLVGHFLRNLGGSPYYNINTTYADTVGGGHTLLNSVTYTGYWADNTLANIPATGPSSGPSDSAVQQEIVRGFTNGKFTYDPSTVYAVLSAKNVYLGGRGAFNQYCAYHGSFVWSGKTVLYAVMPDPATNLNACAIQNPGPNGASNADADALISVLAHELEEAATDPQVNVNSAWYMSNGNENADACAWTFGTTYASGGASANMNLGGKDFMIQRNWVNASGGYCALSYGSVSATAPSAPQNPGTSVSGSNVTVTWSAPASNGGSAITGYNLYRGSSPNGETLYQALGNVLTYQDNAVPNGTWYYKVTATNGIGEGPQSTETSAVAPAVAPTAPGAPSITAAPGSGKVTLTITPPASNGGSAITGYTIYRGTTPGGESLLGPTGTGSTYTDTSVTAGQIYYYKVTASNIVGPGGASNEASATPTSGVPSAPTLTAAPNSGFFFARGVRLTWTAPVTPNGTITGYKIYRGSSSGTETLLTTVAGSSSGYVDQSTTSGGIYYYQVTATNAAGESARSNESSARAK